MKTPLKESRSIKEIVHNLIYSTPYRLSTAVFVAVHSSLALTQLARGNNYIQSRIEQIREHPISTPIEILVPYFVTYLSSTLGKKLRGKIENGSK